MKTTEFTRLEQVNIFPALHKIKKIHILHNANNKMWTEDSMTYSRYFSSLEN